MKFTSQHTIGAMFSGVIFLVAVAVPVYLYLQIQSTQSYVRDVAGQLSTQAAAEQTLSLTRQALVDTEVDRAQLDALALPADGAATFIEMIEKEATTAGVALTVGSVSSDQKQKTFDTLSLSFKVTGSFAGVTRFLKLVETLPYASTVTSIVFLAGDGKVATWDFTGVITVPVHKQ